jgi:hypothetical protein
MPGEAHRIQARPLAAKGSLGKPSDARRNQEAKRRREGLLDAKPSHVRARETAAGQAPRDPMTPSEAQRCPATQGEASESPATLNEG